MKQITTLDDVKIDLDVFIEQIKETVEFDEWKEEASKLKGFDLWPFNEDGDEHQGVYEEMRNNAEIIGDVILATVNMVEEAFASITLLDNPQKHAIVREFLDDAIRLPFWAEWADGPLLDMLITLSVRLAKQTKEQASLVLEFNGGAMQIAGAKNQSPHRIGLDLVKRQMAKDDAEAEKFGNMGE